MRRSTWFSDHALNFLAAVATGALLLWASFHPTDRIWGLSVWAYLDVRVRFLLCALLWTTAAAWLLKEKSSEAGPTKNQRPSVALQVLTVATVSGVFFYALRTQVHFLGDGYLLLKSLASENPLLRARNFGEMLVHRWVRDVLPLDRASAALASFRIVSIGAGVCHAVLVIWLSRRLVGDTGHPLLFSAGMMTGGYALLYFGYVENYSLFGLSVAAFVYLGMLVAMGLIHSAWILVALAASVFFHALGMTLLLPALYLLVTRTTLPARWRRVGATARFLVIGALVLALGACAHLALKRSMPLMFALVPMRGDMHLLERYSMFSRAHAADVVNLALLLVPGLLLFATASWSLRWNRVRRDPRVRFLAVTAVAALGAVFLFEAKLGMPRDWDLFSFAGYPWMALCLLAVLLGSPPRQARPTMLCVVTIGLVCLGPRVITARTPERGVTQFRDYADIDVRKNRSGWFVLQQYYLERGDSSNVKLVINERARRFPENGIMNAADAALKAWRIDEAMELSRQAIQINPTLSSNWSRVGACYVGRNQMDSAIMALNRADALNPDDPLVSTLLGLAYYRSGRVSRAEDALLEAHRLDPQKLEPILALARLNKDRGDLDRYVTWLEKAAYLMECRGETALELGDACLERGNLVGAARALQEAVRKGVDSSEVRQRLESRPDLAALMNR